MVDQLSGSGIVKYLVVPSFSLHELAKVWEKNGFGSSHSLVSRYEKWKEKAFLTCTPFIIAQASGKKKLSLEVSILRDLIVLSFFYEVTDRSLLPFFSEVWKEGDTHISKNLSFFKKVINFGETEVFFTPKREEDLINSLEAFFGNKSLAVWELSEMGKVYNFSEKFSGGNIFVGRFAFLYNEDAHLTFNFLWKDFLIASAAYHKVFYNVSRYQEKRLSLISQKKAVDSYVQSILSFTEGGRQDELSKLSKIEEASDILSQHAAWLTQSSNETRNLITLIEQNLGVMQEIFLKHSASLENSFWQEEISSFKFYANQAKNDLDYLKSTLADVEMVLRNLKDRADILSRQIQEKFYRRLILLVFIAVGIVIFSVVFYFYFTSTFFATT